jgi:hypothetical protein
LKYAWINRAIVTIKHKGDEVAKVLIGKQKKRRSRLRQSRQQPVVMEVKKKTQINYSQLSLI